jgi:hypothetical protein
MLTHSEGRLAYVETPGEKFGKCETRLWNEWPEWSQRSIAYAASPQLRDEPDSYGGETAIGTLANALAGTGVAPSSVELIDRLIDLLNGILFSDKLVLARRGVIEKRWPADIAPERVGELFLTYRTFTDIAKSLQVARFAAGGQFNEATAKALTADGVAHMFWWYPHTQIAQRLLSLSEADQALIGQATNDLDLILRLNSLVREGRGAEARALAAQHSGTYLEFPGDRPLLRMVGVLQNAGMRSEAVAMLDAYLELTPTPDRIAVHLLLVQGRPDRAKAMLRQQFALGLDVFTAAMLLAELGDPIDLSRVKVPGLWDKEHENVVRNWLDIMDALAWRADDTAIESMGRNPPAEVSALSAVELACVRDTVTGLQAVALARRGSLEGGLWLVAGRTLEQRGYCIEMDKFSYTKTSFFNPLYLVQQWLERGNGAN